MSHLLLQEVLPDSSAGSGIPNPDSWAPSISALTKAGLSLLVTAMLLLLGSWEDGTGFCSPIALSAVLTTKTSFCRDLGFNPSFPIGRAFRVSSGLSWSPSFLVRNVKRMVASSPSLPGLWWDIKKTRPWVLSWPRAGDCG